MQAALVPGEPIGEVALTHDMGTGTIAVDRADPRILVSAELLEAIEAGDGSIWTRCARVGRNCDCAAPCTHYATLEIRGANARYTYAIRGLMPDGVTYLAERPG